MYMPPSQEIASGFLGERWERDVNRLLRWLSRMGRRSDEMTIDVSHKRYMHGRNIRSE